MNLLLATLLTLGIVFVILCCFAFANIMGEVLIIKPLLFLFGLAQKVREK